VFGSQGAISVPATIISFDKPLARLLEVNEYQILVTGIVRVKIDLV
jgi:hypothetical protein